MKKLRKNCVTNNKNQLFRFDSVTHTLAQRAYMHPDEKKLHLIIRQAKRTPKSVFFFLFF